MTAYGYLRKSVVRDLANPGDSPAAQERAIRDMAAMNGDADVVILSDLDKSGRLGRERRPGYNALLEAIESGACSAVYSYSLSRLARSTLELLSTLQMCEQRSIPVRLAKDVIDTSTASGRMTTTILSAVATFEADVARERVMSTIAEKRARGERLGARPYGDGDGKDAQVVLDAFREAGSYSGAARLLNERGVTPRTGKRGWWPSAVAVVVNRLDPQPMRPSTKGAKAGGTDFLLAGLLRCPTCGTRLTGTRDRGGSRVRYSCRLGSVTPHARVSVTEHLILPSIVDEVARLVTPKRVESETTDARQRAALDDRRARVLDMYESGLIDKVDRDARLGKVYADLLALDAKRVVLEVPEVDWTWSPKRLNAVLRALFVKIELDPVTFQPNGFTWTVPEWRASAA